jgi:hypothetical protein
MKSDGGKPLFATPFSRYSVHSRARFNHHVALQFRMEDVADIGRFCILFLRKCLNILLKIKYLMDIKNKDGESWTLIGKCLGTELK